ncbi:MAG: hypothetical protein AVDCRST_MAG19-3811 [uncultured Thermomicrobiales bacterium]|uniref:Uncharacterized protein n=1 Tax=uncultured Thermomicrobiales bacterium TaxID=1645740 RepID=A0A6J4VJM0_9BACT|nr:MAG: hypothetical protein AVDCRST_MAG19-3811 [uncultured Thermomicrobiales bacterium]
MVIRRGDVAAGLVAFAGEHGTVWVATAESPSPRFAAIRDEVVRSLPVEVLPVTRFVAYSGHLDLDRFSRYCRVAQRHAFGQPPLFEGATFDGEPAAPGADPVAVAGPAPGGPFPWLPSAWPRRPRTPLRGSAGRGRRAHPLAAGSVTSRTRRRDRSASEAPLPRTGATPKPAPTHPRRRRRRKRARRQHPTPTRSRSTATR